MRQDRIRQMKVSWQGVFSLAGMLAALAAAFWMNGKNKTVAALELVCGFLFEILGMAAGAKLLYLLLHMGEIAVGSFWDILKLVFTGFSFYGAIAGGVVALWFYCRIFGIGFGALLRALGITYPFIYAFAKIGCGVAGCCYGVLYDGPLSVRCAGGIRRFPLQWLDALLGFFVAAYCLREAYMRKTGGVDGKRAEDAGRNGIGGERAADMEVDAADGKSAEDAKKGCGVGTFGSFLTLHAVQRFFLEFLRGAGAKDMVGALSVNQIVSLCVLAGVLAYAIWRRGNEVGTA